MGRPGLAFGTRGSCADDLNSAGSGVLDMQWRVTEPACAKYKVTAKIPLAGGAAAGCTVKVASAGGDGPPERPGTSSGP